LPKVCGIRRDGGNAEDIADDVSKNANLLQTKVLDVRKS